MKTYWLVLNPDSGAYTGDHAYYALMRVFEEFGFDRVPSTGRTRDTGFGQEEEFYLPDGIQEDVFEERLATWLSECGKGCGCLKL